MSHSSNSTVRLFPESSPPSMAADTLELIADWPANAGPEARLLRHLQHSDVDGGELDALMQLLVSEKEPQRLWYLLRCADLAPSEALDLDIVFRAVRRLASSDCVFLRADGYRRLAGLHRINLRFEMRAKRELAKGLDRETGLAKGRVAHLLALC